MTIQDFKFPDLSNCVEKETALMLGKITHHIHPDIVNYITKENENYKIKFEKNLP